MPELSPENLRQRYALLCESTRPEPDETMLPYRVEQALLALEMLLKNGLKTLSLKAAPANFSDIYQAMERELDRLREFCAFPVLGSKFVVAFGGGFSSGKSSLINALLGRKLLVTEVDPTTSLPTYVLKGERDEVSALNLFGHRVLLSEDEFLSLTHDEPLLYGSHISRLLRAAFMSRTDFPWPNLAIIDTPGYSKDGEGTHSERTDEHIARTQLNAAQAIVWVVNAKQGCITEDDLGFLATLKRDIPLFIAISRADQKPDAALPAIQQVICKALEQRQIPVAGIAAVSARKPRAWPLAPLQAQLQQWSEQTCELRFAQNFQAEFQRYDRFLAEQQAQAQGDLGRLNLILSLSDHRDARSEAAALKDQSQTQYHMQLELAQALKTLWNTFGAQLYALGQQVGMEIPEPGELCGAGQSAQVVAGTAPAVHTAKRGLQPGDVLCDGEGLPELLWLPGGSFRMGSNEYSSEQPIHTVNVQPFALGKYPVTQAQWRKVMGNNPSHFTGDDSHPVENVSWNGAQAFIQKLNGLTGHTYRLPSEAEWEYACRAGSTGKWCFGDDESLLREYAWYDANSGSSTQPVGRKKPNAWGLCDMHGNVWEWCEDTWHSDYKGALDDGRAWVGGDGVARVLRGGCWDFKASNARAGSRVKISPVSHFYSFGFRVARTAP